jgi:hypothetical protein
MRTTAVLITLTIVAALTLLTVASRAPADRAKGGHGCVGGAVNVVGPRLHAPRICLPDGVQR